MRKRRVLLRCLACSARLVKFFLQTSLRTRRRAWGASAVRYVRDSRASFGRARKYLWLPALLCHWCRGIREESASLPACWGVPLESAFALLISLQVSDRTYVRAQRLSNKGQYQHRRPAKSLWLNGCRAAA